VVGSMRRSDHGTPVIRAAGVPAAVATDLAAGRPGDLSMVAIPILFLVFGGAIMVLRSNPARLQSATV
jgi:hypothetical protein